ncbi:GtrA family protein [Umezawaea tangerina]|uniref:Putative flippase GtrA n=1 Tax=Umezawaea tangerina TaxID=84725 RepID=A0A2T0THR2_9PSEU|nr:GtrA family protein [Umezawaea tangerina]PRY45244.1 putative flippase GtrA [Umezawaea tangerina]
MMIDLVRRDHPAPRTPRVSRALVGQAVRFGLVGTASTLATFAAYGLFRLVIPAVLANLLAIAATTVASAELHRRVTFSGATAVPDRMAVQNLVSWAWSSGATSVGLVVLGSFVVEPTYVQETAAMTVMTVVGGVARFAALRWWVLVPRRSV